MRLFRFLLVILILLLAGCGSYRPQLLLPSLMPYRMDIQQGNFVTQDMIAKLQPGMTRSQVRFVLGTPLVTDIFHPDRWDYVYRFEKAGKLIEHRRIYIVFSEDKLLRVEGDVVPLAKAELNPAAPPNAAAAPAPAPKQEAQPAAAPAEQK